MKLDLPTVFVLQAISSFTSSVVLGTARRSEERDGTRELQAAMACFVPAFLLQLLRGTAPDGLVIVGSNVLFWIGTTLMLYAYHRFVGMSCTPRWPLGFLSLSSFLFALLWHFGATYAIRAMFTSLVLVVLFFGAMYQLLREDGLSREPSRKVSVVLIALTAIPMAIRVFVLLPHYADHTMTAGSFPLESILGFIPSILLSQGLGLVFLMMQRERGEERAKTLAITDALTGCLNRRALEDRVRAELAYTKRVGRSFAVLVVDLDHFKKINDTYGHATGDAVLVHAAKILSGVVRPSDLVARYGGEEFCILLRDSNTMSAATVAERVCTSLRESPIDVEGKSLVARASVGVSVYEHASSESWELVFQRADAALYRAKQGGRDRFELSH
jgi:diguanylate cyclase (GGDEF)-like protein